MKCLTEDCGVLPLLLSVTMRILSNLQVQLRTGIPAEVHFWSCMSYGMLLGPVLPPAGFASCSVSSRVDHFLAMQLLLSLESGSVCHTHSSQDLKHLVQKMQPRF